MSRKIISIDTAWYEQVNGLLLWSSQVCSFKLHAYGKIYYRTCRAKLFLLTHGMNKSTGFYYGLGTTCSIY